MDDEKYVSMSSCTFESICRESLSSGFTDELDGFSDNPDSCDYSGVISFMDSNDDAEPDSHTIKEDDSDIDPSSQTARSSIKKKPKKINRMVSIHQGKLSTPLDLPDATPPSPMRFTLQMQQENLSNMRRLTNSPTNSEMPYYKYTITDIPSPPNSFISTSHDTELETDPESETMRESSSMYSPLHHSLSSHQSQSTPTSQSQCSTLIFPTPPDSIPRLAFVDLTRASSKSAPQQGIDAGCIIDEELLSPFSHLSSHSSSSSFVCFTIGKEFGGTREVTSSKLKSSPSNRMTQQILSQDQDSIREEGTIQQPTIINRTVHPGASNFSLPWTQHSTQSHNRVYDSSSTPTNHNTKIKAVGTLTYFRPMMAYLSLDAFLFFLLVGSIVMFVFLRSQKMDFSSSLVFLIASILLIVIEVFALLYACRFTYIHMRKRHDFPIPIAITR